MAGSAGTGKTVVALHRAAHLARTNPDARVLLALRTGGCVYLHDFEDGPQARQTIGTWIRYYNEERPHSTHADDRTPMEEYARRRAA